MFELAPVGVAAVLVGIAYLVWISPRLLPQTRAEELGAESIRAYLTEVVITEGSPLHAKPLRESRLSEMGLAVRAILRGKRRVEPDAGVTLSAGDLLIVQGGREALLKVKETAGIEIKPDLHLGELAEPATKIVEALLMPQSSLVGRSLKELDFRRRFGVTAIALYRRGHTLATRIGSLPLRAGDVLLLQGPAERFATLTDGAEMFILEEVDHQPDRRRKGAWALGLFALAVTVSSLGWVELPVAFLLASLGVVATRLITIEEAYDLINWRLLVLISGMTAFGLAMQKTGTAEYLAGVVVEHFAPLGVTAVMLAFVVLTILLTQPMSNAAAALVVLPVAMTTAVQLDLSPRTFAVLVTLAASLSFITPFEPSCLIVYGPGKYRFRDYVLVGLPLTALSVAVIMLLVPVLWPLEP
jgi:di/tricarboxylate transporter